MSNAQIVASVLIRNEDIYIERVIRNILEFCDKIIITDHGSTDKTFEICRSMADVHSKIELTSIQSPREAALVLEPFIGTNTWIFGVDGDEVYDPKGLKTMRSHLLNGVFFGDWCIFGNVLNIESLNLNEKMARGYLAPPSRSMTKLYNFSMINSWNNSPERLLGDDIKFKNGFNPNLRRLLHVEIDWDQSYFRCLHLPFMKRSSQQNIRFAKTRLNPDEKNRINMEKNNVMKIFRMAHLLVLNFLGRDWKNQKYRRGALVEKDVSAFFVDTVSE